jgi:multiple antibiotic resistance protein
MPPLSSIRINDIITISFTLFAIIDVIGSVPVVISFKQQHPNFNPFSVTAFAGLLMLLFLFVGEQLLNIIGLDIKSFAMAGALVVFILGLELISGHSFFKSEKDVGSAGSLVPLGFPILAGSGTLTTLLSLKAIYSIYNIVLAVLINLIVVFIVLRSVDWIEKKLGKAGILVMKKFFGVILIAIAIKMFKANFPSGIL